LFAELLQHIKAYQDQAKNVNHVIPDLAAAAFYYCLPNFKAFASHQGSSNPSINMCFLAT
jgi:hypothetical protein